MKVLLTCARSYITLDLARLLKKAGHTVYVADTSYWHVCRSSNAVTESFIIPSPRFEPQRFAEALSQIAKDNRVDLLIPIWEEIFTLSKYQHLFPKECSIFSAPFEQLISLHDKWAFMQKLKNYGISHPETYLIQSESDLKSLKIEKPFALKASYTRASQNVIKISPEYSAPAIAISSKNPWIAQEWLEGKKYCTYSLCQNGKLMAHSTYPVDITFDQHSCITFKATHHPSIEEWVRKFVALENFTGHIAFDFFELADGQLMPIECNPRATSGLHLFHAKDAIDRVFFNPIGETIRPSSTTPRQIFAGMLMFGWRTTSFPKYLKALFTHKDIVFSLSDIKPFLSMPILMAAYCQWARKYNTSLAFAFSYDIEWNG